VWKVEKIVKKGAYLYALVPEHPYATKNGYVLEHRVVMENHLNRLLNPDEVVEVDFVGTDIFMEKHPR